MNESHIGERVKYFDQVREEPQLGRITGQSVKNGEATFTVLLDNGDLRWGYAEQFEVLKED